MKSMYSFGILVGGLALAACGGSTPPPKELTQARAELQRASGSDTASLAPAEVTIAKEAVGRADNAAASGEDEANVKDLSNAALSRVQAAEARAAEARASRVTASAKTELSTLTVAARDRMLESERAALKDAEMKAQRQMDRLAKLANLKQEKRGYVLTLSESTLFKTNEAALLPSGKTSLDSIASVLKETESPKIEINAFVSPKVKKTTQAPLSEKRAKAVSDYFQQAGIPAERLAPYGFGAGEGSNVMPDPAANGRIEIIVPAPTAAATKPATKP